MRRSEVHRILAGRGWLAGIDPALAAAVIEAGRVIELRRGEALYHPGDEPGGMYGVAEGGIVLSTMGRNGLPVAGHIVRPCSWFGYASVFDRQRRMLIPAANEASLVLNVSLGEMERLRDSFPSAGRAFGQLAMRGEAVYLAIVTDLLIADAHRRLAAVLMRVAGAETPDRPRTCPLTRWLTPGRGPGRAADPGDAGRACQYLAPHGRPLCRPGRSSRLDRLGEIRTRAHSGLRATGSDTMPALPLRTRF